MLSGRKALLESGHKAAEIGEAASPARIEVVWREWPRVSRPGAGLWDLWRLRRCR